MIADSNIIIFVTSGKFPMLENWFIENTPSVSAITVVEVLGYHKLKAEEKVELENFFNNLRVLYPTAEVFQHAVALRQKHSISLGDSLIAGTALHYNLPLATHNTQDFTWISSLELVDPIRNE